MKPSYFVTPRTLDDATFYSWGAAIHKPAAPNVVNTADKVILCVCAVAVLVVATLIATGN